MAFNYHIKTSFDLCTGCRLCQIACSFRIHQAYNPSRGLLRIRESTENLYHLPQVCNQCQNPFCANVCPVDAITRDPDTMALVINADACVACGLCSRYCPLEMVLIDPDSKKALKCDLCGGYPACVKACPTGALDLAITCEGNRNPTEENGHD